MSTTQATLSNTQKDFHNHSARKCLFCFYTDNRIPKNIIQHIIILVKKNFTHEPAINNLAPCSLVYRFEHIN